MCACVHPACTRARAYLTYYILRRGVTMLDAPPPPMPLQVNVRSQNSRRVRRGAPAEDGGGDDPAASAALDPAAGVAANQAADTLLPQKVADAAIRCMAACYELIDTEALYVVIIEIRGEGEGGGGDP